jgi:hypothetical protein
MRVLPKIDVPGESGNTAVKAGTSASPSGQVWAKVRLAVMLAAAPGRSVPLLRERLRQGGSDPRRVARLIADLDNDDFAVRERSSEELAKLGDAVAPALRRSLEGSPSPETRLRVRGLLEKLEGPTPAPERLRRVRSVEVLELAGTSEARQLLEAVVAEDPGTELGREAKAALGRLSRRTR